MNYTSMGRTNYFPVTDEKRYNVLFEGLFGENKMDFTKIVNGKTLHGFGADNGIDFALLASEDEEVKKYMEKGEALYDEELVEVPVSEYDEKTELYNKNHEIVYERGYDGVGFEVFIQELQKILPDGECFAFEEIGHEGHRYLSGSACVATNKEVKWFNTSSFINDTAKEMTGKTTSCVY